MNPFFVKEKGDTPETAFNEDEYIPGCITTSSSSRSSCLPKLKTPKPIAGIPVPRLELWSSNSESYNSDNDIEPGLNIKNIKVPSLRDTPGQVLEYIEEINSINEILTMKVKSLNIHIQVLHSREDDSLNRNSELKGTVRGLTEELENFKRSSSFKGNSCTQTSNKTAAVFIKVTNENYDKTTRFVKNANTQLTNQKTGKIETTIATQTSQISKKPTVAKISKTKAVKIPQKQTGVKVRKPKDVKITPQKGTKVNVIKPKDGKIPQGQVEVKISKPKAMIPQKQTDVNIIKLKDLEIPQTLTDEKVKTVMIPQKTHETVNRKSNETVATITSKSQATTTNTLSFKPLKGSRGAQNTSKLSKSTLSTESSKQESANKKISLPGISFPKDMSSRHSSGSPEIVTARTRTTSNSTKDFNEFVYSSEFPSPQSSEALTQSSIEGELSISSCSSLAKELSVYSCSSPELMIQTRFEGVHKTDKATAVHGTSSPDVSYSIKKISSLNTNHTVIKNIKKPGSLLPSLVEYPKINTENSATPPKIKSTSSVFENPQRRFHIAKKIGAAPLPNPMKELPSISVRYNSKPPASPRPNTKKIKLPSLQSKTKFYKRQD